MKKGLKITLIAALILLGIAMILVALFSSGRVFNGYYLGFEVNKDKETCTVTKYIPFGANDVVVPENIGGYRVTEIASYAFANRSNLISISLPDSIEKIEIGAFYECSGLTDITIPNSVTSIGSYAFFGCESLTTITLSPNVTEIGARVFEGCTRVTAATVSTSAISALPAESITLLTVNGGTQIGTNAFQNFKNLESITISPTVEKVDEKAFYGCESILTANVPASVCPMLPQNNLMQVVINSGTHIPEKAFYYCNHLTSIVLPESITSIGSLAFNGCYKLVEIYNLSPLIITKGSRDNGCIGQYALHIYTSTEETSKIWVDADGYLFCEDGNVCYLLGYMGKDTKLILPEDCHGKDYVIREYAFYMGGNITSITVPLGVIGIDARTFWHCASLTEITFPDSLTFIGERAFYECDNLEQISFGKNLTSIGEFAFDDCDKLTRVYFRGTTEEWKQVSQGRHWAYYTSAAEVICTDGSVSLK